MKLPIPLKSVRAVLDKLPSATGLVIPPQVSLGLKALETLESMGKPSVEKILKTAEPLIFPGGLRNKILSVVKLPPGSPVKTEDILNSIPWLKG